MFATLFFASFVGLSLCIGGNIFTMTQKEIDEATPLHNGLELAVDKLNMKNDRKENVFR